MNIVMITRMASEIIASPSVDGDDESEDVGRDPDSLPWSKDRSGLCPRCNRISNFDHLSHTNTYGSAEKVVILRCHGCMACTVVIEKFESIDRMTKWRPVHWWPVPGAAIDMKDVPPDMASAYQEGVRCISVQAPHAAVAMFRNALAHIVQDRGSDAAKKKRTLNDAIQQMVDDRTLFDQFNDWATQVRTVGNAGAHQESWEEIPLEEAKELQQLTYALIEFLYIQPAAVKRMRPPTKRLKQ